MSLILCLENITGQDVNLEVFPTDDFDTFLDRAKDQLGYRPQLGDITEGKPVATTDNIYDFLIDAEMSKNAPKNQEDDFTDVEYLAEDERPAKTQDGEPQEYSQAEFLEEDSDESEVMDVETLDSSLEDDPEEDVKTGKMDVARLEEQLGEFEHALSDLLQKDAVEPVKETKYTKEDLLDMLDSPAVRKRDRETEALKRTVTLPTVSLPRLTDEDIDRMTNSPEEIKKFQRRHPPTYKPPTKQRRSVYLHENRYLPSKYDDVDNEGVYDYMDEEFILSTDVNDLLTINKNRPVSNEDVVEAEAPPVKRPRGRPRKTDVRPRPIQKHIEKEDYDKHIAYLDAVVRYEKDDPEDEDYVPGQHVDWQKAKKSKERYDCRLCGDFFPKFGLAISHALTHRVSGKAVFPCIMCAYAYSTYIELQKHMKLEHRKKKSPKKPLNPNETPRPRGRPGRKPKHLVNREIKVEIIDNEEVCDVEILEEWLEEEEEAEPEPQPEILYYIEEIPDTAADVPKWEPLEIKQENSLTKQISNEPDDDDYDMTIEEEWLGEDDEDEYKVSEESESSSDDVKRKRKRVVYKNFKHKCNLCLNSYPSIEQLEKHRCYGFKSSRMPKGSFRCAMCGQTLPSRNQLIAHQSYHHVELIEMNMTCNKCEDKKFSSEVELFDHMNSEHNVEFSCDHPGCEKEFRLRSALRAHMRVHGKRCHQCSTCGKQFYDIHNLKEHKIMHLPVKPFQCHICKKFLNRKSRLRMHLLSHEANPSENSVICCKHCKMAFKDVAEAEAHVSQSEECCKNIIENYNESELNDDMPDVDDEAVKNEEMNEEVNNFFIEPYTDIGTTEGEVTSEALSNNAIICVPLKPETNNTISIANNDEMIDGDMKALLDEVGAVKIILKDSDQREDLQESSNYGIINVPIEYDLEKQMIKNEDASVGVDSVFFAEVINSVDEHSKLAIEEPSQETVADNSQPVEEAQKVENQNSITQRVIVSREDLLKQIDDRTKLFVNVLKIKMVFRCEYCEKSYCTKEALTEHRKCHEGLRNPFVCNVCNTAFSTFARCTSHKTTHGYYKSSLDSDSNKSNLDLTNFDSFPVLKHYLCQHCSKSFLHWTYLQVHKRHNHGQEKYYFNCRICGEKFTDSWSLNSHRRKFHADIVSVKKSANTSYKCADCGAGFNKRLLLGKHRFDHHGDVSMVKSRNKRGPFSCTSCDKMYQTKVGLEGHMRTHDGGVYLCDLCGNGFAHKIGLETHHKRVHLKTIKYPCHDCGQNFFSQTELETHKRCHTGEKPFPCDYCDMAFRTKGRRNEHHRTHTGERPYPCDLCGLAFRRSNAMKNHRLTHTGERRHVCPLCPKLFHVQSNLKNHMKLKHPNDYVVLEVKGKAEDQPDLETSLKLFSNSDGSITKGEMQEDPTINEPGQMMVLEDVIIEDESQMLGHDSNTNILEYTYTTDDIAQIQGSVISHEYSNGIKKEPKIQIQLMDETDSGHSLLYTVDGTTTDADLRLIGGEVRYALVDDLSDDAKAQFTIIDTDQFVKDEGDGQNHIYKLDCP